MPISFNITVSYNNIEYQVGVIRTSPGVTANTYYSSIIQDPNVLNRYPPIIYTAVKDDLVFEDKLELLLPSFAEIQKEEIMKYLKKNNISL